MSIWPELVSSSRCTIPGEPPGCGAVISQQTPCEQASLAQAKVVVENVSKVFVTKRGSLEALENVSLQVNEGQFVCLVGQSGCGKSTLLNIIAGLEKPDCGRVLADGKPVTEPGADRMMMFQESALFPWLNVIENVLFGLKLKPNLTRSERFETAGCACPGAGSASAGSSHGRAIRCAGCAHTGTALRRHSTNLGAAEKDNHLCYAQCP